MYPTRGQVKARWQAILDDPSGSVFSEAVFAPAFGEAFDTMYQAMLTAQCPRIELMINFTVPPMTTSLTPAELGISDFADFVFLRERPLGSTDKYRDMTPVDVLSQRPASTLLREYNWRNNTFYLLGATQAIDLQVKFEASGEAPTDDSAQILVDSSMTFLANYAVGVAGGRKGYQTTAQRCLALAVGPKFDQGTMGGALFMLIQPLVRSRQNVQIAHKPFRAGRWLYGRRAIPYVAAQQGTTGGGAQNVPIQLSTATNDGSIVGAIDGVNTIFTLNIFGIISQMIVFRNGVAQTYLVDYTYLGNQITFMDLSIPQVGDSITCEIYLEPGP